MPMRKNIQLDFIRLDGGTQPRESLNADAIDDYAAALTESEDLPPVDVFFDGSDYWLADGFHRYHAHRKADFRTINAEVHNGTAEDARWFSCAANKGQDKAGLRRTNADKRRQVETALKLPQSMKMSDNAIAAYIGVSQNMVSTYRRSLKSDLSERTVRVCADGREMDVSNIGKGGGLRTLAHEIGEDADDKPTKEYINGDTGEVIENLVTVTTKATKADVAPAPDEITGADLRHLRTLLHELKAMTDVPALQFSPVHIRKCVGQIVDLVKGV